jgi:hypothetical protein
VPGPAVEARAVAERSAEPRVSRREEAIRTVRAGEAETAARERVGQARGALETAAERRATTERSLKSAEQLVAETKTDATYTAKDRETAAKMRDAAAAELKTAVSDERRLTSERAAMEKAQDRIANLSAQTDQLTKNIDAAYARNKQIATPEIHQMQESRRLLQTRLQDEVAGLHRSLTEQATAATPGVERRPMAIDNANLLPTELRPAGNVPIDVTTGKPMTARDLVTWEADHIMPRAEISRDPRFARLTPSQREFILLDIPENYMPLTKSANGSKSGRTIPEWIANRAQNKNPVPGHLIEPLAKADQVARAAVEAAFKRFLGE